MKKILLSVILLCGMGLIIAQKQNKINIPNHDSFILKDSSGFKQINILPKGQINTAKGVNTINKLINKQLQTGFLNLYLRDSIVQFDFSSPSDSIRYEEDIFAYNSNNVD